MHSIMVVGLREKDAGKTVVAQAVIEYLKEKGVNVCGFKPKAGNSFWYDYDVVYESLLQGRLYGKDAKILKNSSKTDLPEEVINPIHRLWVENSTYIPINGLPSFLVDRVTISEDGKFFIVINRLELEKYPECEKFLENLCLNAEKIFEVSDVCRLNSIIKEYYDKAVELAYKRIKQDYDIIVMESYSDIALPWDKIENVKNILAVEPWHIYLYNPDKYLTAVKLSTKLRKEGEISTLQVKQLVKPAKEVKVAPSRSREISRKLKEKIEEILVES